MRAKALFTSNVLFFAILCSFCNESKRLWTEATHLLNPLEGNRSQIYLQFGSATLHNASNGSQVLEVKILLVLSSFQALQPCLIDSLLRLNRNTSVYSQ